MNYRYVIASATLLISIVFAQPDFLASFPNLQTLELPEGNVLYHPAGATIESDIELSSSAQTIMRFEQVSKKASSNYVVRAGLPEDGGQQLRWTVLYNTSNISNSLDINAHTVVLPANGNLYSIETVPLRAPLALDSLEVQHKYVLQGDVLTETPQPFFYIGQPTTTTDFITLRSLPEGGERIAGIAANSPVTILSLSVTAEGAYLLIASPFGLAGWLPVTLELAASNAPYLAALSDLSPLTSPPTSPAASPPVVQLENTPSPAPVGSSAPNVAPDMAVLPAPAPVAAPVAVESVSKLAQGDDATSAQQTRSNNGNSTSNANMATQEIFTVENVQGQRWLGFSHQHDSELAWLIEARLELDVVDLLDRESKADLPRSGEVVGYVSYAPSYPCTSQLHFVKRKGKLIYLKEILLTGEEICVNRGTVTLTASQAGKVLWRYYQPDGSFDSDVVLVEAPVLNPEHSVARHWNEALLTAIRQDFARPTVHARNLYHTALALYDAWAVFDATAETVLLGKDFHGFACDFAGFDAPEGFDTVALQEEAMSFAAYHLLEHRFSGAATTDTNRENRPFYGYLLALGYEPQSSTDYSTGSAAALGTHIADCIISFGMQDGANEGYAYLNQSYAPRNRPLDFQNPGIEDIDPNHWQPLSFALGGFTDQSGNAAGTVPDFLGAEWGNVLPFALQESERHVYQRHGDDYVVYHDPGQPPLLLQPDGEPSSAEEAAAYAWGFALVAAWSAHLDPRDDTMVDISPRSLGNLPLDELPETLEQYQQFYNILTGEDPSHGHELNPYTGEPYQPQRVRRGDYTRVLAEFWADGPDSETPPGHWFTILNYVSDHPAFVPRLQGQGDILPQLEWDVKAYLALGGAVHDAAISAWGIKGWYDYVRPISAIRYMAKQGQRSDPNLPNYSPKGIPLVKGVIELVQKGDPLAEEYAGNINRIKIRAWRGQDIADNQDGVAGVDWILADTWMPYQRANFVTPPFAGYVSGHSTFSRAAAEVLTLLTGDAFFPGGMGEFYAPKNEFLVFEEGPSEDIILQWATYRDASDQTALSRIWGGIHPPADDIPGRLLGVQIGQEAFAKALQYFTGASGN